MIQNANFQKNDKGQKAGQAGDRKSGNGNG